MTTNNSAVLYEIPGGFRWKMILKTAKHEINKRNRPKTYFFTSKSSLGGRKRLSPRTRFKNKRAVYARLGEFKIPPPICHECVTEIVRLVRFSQCVPNEVNILNLRRALTIYQNICNQN